ncbi:hypothetical protein [Henriciella litoralis]|uniref:hypothetical protein n=1 Tax=Henriciella litoralis TaxID=568102 RepID=UPI0009FD0F42|nr:hypothetical protein [Henriciella litoralis]
MPKITGYRLVKEEYEYELSLDLDDQAIMEDQLSIDVIARRRHIKEAEWIEVKVTLKFEFPKPIVRVFVEDKHIGDINLDFIRIDGGDDLGPDWDPLESAYEGTPLENAIELIPVDPVFGCLIKAGISTTLGQSIRCYDRARETHEGFRQRIRETFVCLGDSSVLMIMRATARTFRCMIMLGF